MTVAGDSTISLNVLYIFKLKFTTAVSGGVYGSPQREARVGPYTGEQLLVFTLSTYQACQSSFSNLYKLLAEPSDRSCWFAIFVVHQAGPVPSLSRSLRLAQMASILGFHRRIRYGSLLRRRNGVSYRDVRT